MFMLTTRNGNRLADRPAFQSLFEDLLEEFPLEPVRGEFTPRIHLSEDEANYHLRTELPGVAEKDVRLEYENGILTLRAERKEEKSEKEGEKVLYSECSACSYARSFELPDVDVEKAQAALKDGVLSVTLPKQEKAKPRSIKIN
jgi:HSP20 family protein